MGAAALFCAGNDNAVFDGPDRTEALGKLEFIGDLVVDVDTLAVIVENRSGKNMPYYVVIAMNDGSHLCSCRTLQTLGLCYRHFWMVMRLSCKFRSHIGILNQHWLVEQGRRSGRQRLRQSGRNRETTLLRSKRMPSERRRLCRLEARRVGGRPSPTPQLSSLL